ncbi:pyruvate flavodoxin/ferredoxin oxidoreductase domain protein [Methanocaldococcus infernus ME]|uniref:Pyruvate synthase subunit PorA n=1 Tax=Methanocaldococcus infernus (strain DSM 11812 / JCM 15783 / ME) TaxID=573063 RepID=D5VTT6_METIM|nr:pyruvate synthase subunit PorA [Methanocaldococcus infernus]ADG13989.1 pyruvate flavodoxin/ferredoxin oxidoreductase domain protein [Methanocaldococcus infernus ME]
MKKVITGTSAAAEAVRLCDVDVVAAYPITPQTSCVEKIAEFVANGELDAEYIKVESEHSAMAACIGASATGARTFTATASQGLALMHELLFIASGMRLPIVMLNTNRALSAPINIWCDHQDSISQRDTGWIQLYAENNQETLDLVIQAYKIAETVLLPVMVNIDGFILTHTVEPVEIPEEEKVRNFVGVYEPRHAYLDPDRPITQGPVGVPECYMETRKQIEEAMEEAKKVIDKVNKEFEKEFGRKYSLIETYNLENADTVLMAMGSVCGTIKHYINNYDNKVGLIKVRTYRPFPKEEIRKVLEDFDKVGILDKNISFGMNMGALAIDCLTILKDKTICNYIVGLGGRDITIQNIKEIVENLRRAKKDKTEWIGLNK